MDRVDSCGQNVKSFVYFIKKAKIILLLQKNTHFHK